MGSANPSLLFTSTCCDVSLLSGIGHCGGISQPHVVDLQPSEFLLQVKAEKSSRNLGKLQECSRNVNEMAANVVASTRSGQEQIEDKGQVW